MGPDTSPHADAEARAPALAGRRRVLGAAALGLLGPAAGRLRAAVAPAPLCIAVDAEFGHSTATSAEAVRRGAQIAVDEINGAGGVAGRPLAVEVRDNRGVPSRAVQNMRELAARDDVVAVLGGKFSPAVIESIPVAQQMRLPLVATWSAADAITDAPERPSYVFRVSLRDDWAIATMLGHARRHHRAARVGLIVPMGAWGRSCHAAAERHAARTGATPVSVHWYNQGEASLVAGHDKAREAGAEAVLLVANEVEGATLVHEVARLAPAQRLPILSHWGVTGGRFAEMASPSLAQVDFAVVQTFSFLDARGATAQRVLAALRAGWGVADARRVESPVGVAHAYDAVHLLAKAIARAGGADRARIRDALETLGPHQGLVRHYRPAFTAERHEALDASLPFMAAYDRDGALVRLAAR